MKRKYQDEIRSTYGESLAKIERWSPFRQGETTEEWCRLLGPTATVDTHQEYIVDLAEFLLADTKLISPEEKETFLLASLVHDLGEMAISDIPSPLKTDQDQRHEWQHALVFLSSLTFSKEATDAYRQVVMGENMVLHQLFKAIEKSEYFITAMNLFEQVTRHRLQKENLWQLIAKVLAYDSPGVLQHAQQYPTTLGKYFLQRQLQVQLMFQEARSHVQPPDLEAFTRSQALWEAWLSQAEQEQTAKLALR